MDRVALDTSFLIDLQNERRSRGSPRGALEFLRSNLRTEIFLPSVALGEYLEGFEDPDSDEARALVEPLQTLPVTGDVAKLYATTARALRSKGRLIGTNDLWIACTAKASDLPIATRNVEHFRRVSGLAVIRYAK
jgi:tRNA(fMet)-specific endonuclease VapC